MNADTVNADYVLDATELGDLLELGKVEHVIGAESTAQTGEPTALETSEVENSDSSPVREQGESSSNEASDEG